MAVNYQNRIVRDGLVLCLDAADRKSYPGTGTTWFDRSGNGNNGVLTNGASYNIDSIVFDGVNDYVNFGNIFNDVFAGTDKKFTISSWVKYNSILENGNTIVSKIGDSSFSENQRQFVFFVRNPSNSYGSFELEFFVYFSLSVVNYRGYRTVNANIQPNQFYNFAISYDGSIDDVGRFTLYVNSIAYNLTSTFTQGDWGDIQSGSARLSIAANIGDNINNSPIFPLNGRIAQTSIYNRALSAFEIKQNFNATRGRFGI